jgi:hypothetical protein
LESGSEEEELSEVPFEVTTIKAKPTEDSQPAVLKFKN